MSARVFGAAVVCLLGSLAGQAVGAPPRQSWLGDGHVESPIKQIHLRKVARKVLGVGEAKYDEVPLLFGPLQARFAWRKGWKWYESAFQTRLPHGLQGGPMLSIDLPLSPLGQSLSLETQLCALRYVFARSAPRRLLNDELIDPKKKRHSLEAGIYLNISFGRPR
ncbi:MAG TPA: hypothetical protein VIM73_15090 [Polyangiaceae bacterium]